jgi:predicted DCC family thiol-disulfide oxidoreductase YuxK
MVLLLFDGVCNLCNGFVQWVILRDHKGIVKFAPLQSEIGTQTLQRLGKSGQSLDSVVLVEGDRIWTKSEAAIRVATHLGGIWPMAKVLRIFPRFLRDAVYDFVARNRYRWFGQSEQCLLPRPEWKDRFLK